MLHLDGRHPLICVEVKEQHIRNNQQMKIHYADSEMGIRYRKERGKNGLRSNLK
jgi:acid phosphatase class B